MDKSSSHNSVARSRAGPEPEFFVELTQQLLNSIAGGDYQTYQSLCAEDLTCFEPETNGHLVEGLPFHKFFFDLPKASSQKSIPPATVTMSGTHVRLLGHKAAVVSYVRINQFYKLNENGTDLEGPPQVTTCQETRVWEHDGCWKNVHMHRS